MNTDLAAYWPIVWAFWLVASFFVFCVEGVKSYLLHFRYRDLREDTDLERQRLSFLFSIVGDPTRYARTFGASLTSVAVAVSGVCWVGGIALVFGLTSELGLSPIATGIAAVVLLLSAILHGVFLRWLPAALGYRLPFALIRWATLYVALVAWILRPVRAGINLLARLFVWVGIPEPAHPTPIDRDFQILAVGRKDVMFTPVTEKIASRALELNSISVYDILLPRNQVQLFDLNDSIETNLEKARKTGHTRFPLCTGDLDHCEGLIHIKDIFRYRKALTEIELRKMMRPILRVGQDEPLDKILQVLLTKRVHMALVEDDFGGILGVLTLERILEELVGEIQDEFDKEDHMIVQLKKDFYKISGLTPLYEVEDQLAVDNLENDDVSSFGGLITHRLGRIPSAGEQVEIGPLQITVKETDETRVISTTVRVLSLPELLESSES